MSMNESELEKLRTALNGIHLAMGGKELNDAAMGFWILSLRDLNYEDVKEALVNWAKTQKYLPKPADIADRVNKKRLQVYEAKKKAGDGADKRDVVEIDVEAFIAKVHRSANNDTRTAEQSVLDRAKRLKAAEVAGKTILPIHSWWWRRVLGEKC